MKKTIFTHALLLLLGTVQAQVNLPHVLNFTAEDALAWADGIAQDGDGGSEDIIGLDIQIFTADALFALMPGTTITWKDNDYFASGDGNYTAITSGPDIYATNNGLPAMVIRNANPAVNFSLQSINLYDWGGYTPVIIATYNDGVLVGTVEIEFDLVDYLPKNISQADELTPAFFSNIDEIRFYPKSPQTVFNLSMNAISFASPSSLPVSFLYFNARLDQTNCVLEWATAQEQNSSHFDVERSNDGAFFRKVGSIAAQGNRSQTSTYHFVYPSGNDKVNFFRLRQVDLDGKTSFSPVVMLRLKQSFLLEVSPNPGPGLFRLTAGAGLIQQVAVYTAAGTRCISIRGIGASNYTLDLSAFPSGLYFVHARIGDSLEKISIVKQ